MKKQITIEKALDKWCELRDKTMFDINWASGDFYDEHMKAFGLWCIKNKDRIKEE